MKPFPALTRPDLVTFILSPNAALDYQTYIPILLQGAALVAVRTHPMRALANARVAPCRGCALGRSTTCTVAVPLPFACLPHVGARRTPGLPPARGRRFPACLHCAARFTG